MGRKKAHRKAGHISEEDVNLDDLLDGRAGLLEDGLEVVNAGARQLLDRARDQFAFSVAGDRARAVDGARGLDGLGLQGGRGSVRIS